LGLLFGKINVWSILPLEGSDITRITSFRRMWFYT